jgi:monoamine oxidase
MSTGTSSHTSNEYRLCCFVTHNQGYENILRVKDTLDLFSGHSCERMSTIIVGAGVAGITAAYTLIQHGVTDFVILEAAKVPLGRLRQLQPSNWTDFPIDLGAEFIHTNPSILMEILNDANVVINISTVPFKPEYFEWDGTTMYRTPYPEPNDHKFVNYSWYDFFSDYLLPNMSNQIVYDCVVEKVQWSNSSSNVTCENGQNFLSEKVILSAPINVFSTRLIVFEPELSQEVSDALLKPYFAPGFKVFLSFREKFYPESFSVDADFLNLKYAESERFFYDATYGQTSDDYIMGIFAVGEVADRFIYMSSREIIQTSLDELDAIFGNSIASNNFISGKVQNWNREPFIGGAYSFYQSGECQAIDVLREPIKGRLFFAGEAIPNADTDYNNGFVHEASRSGRRAALETLNIATSGTEPWFRRFWHAFTANIFAIIAYF